MSSIDVEGKTLCALVEEDIIDSHREVFLSLIRPANYFCQNCGRSAVDQQNLCNPEPL